MANLKDLIVNGSARIIGKTYSSEFVGNVTGNVTGNLTGDVTGSVSGNAGTATKLKTARSLKITDDGTNTSDGVDFDGSDAVTLKLPSTIKASLTGNATTATTADKTAYGISVGDGVSSTAAISGWKGSENKTLAIKGTSPITTTATTDTITITHNKGGANASGGDTTDQAPGFGGTFKATSATVDEYGHTTALAEHTVTIPNSVATKDANGLMSAADKSTLDSVASAYAGSSSAGGAATSSLSLGVIGTLSTPEEVDNFIEGGKLKYSLFQQYTNIGFGSNDGIILSIPWSSAKYGAQLAFDDTTAGLMKVRGRADNAWGSWKRIWVEGDLIYGAVFNDLADAIPVGEGDVLEAGYCYGFDGEHYTKTSEYMQKSYIGIHSDTYGFKMGHEEGKEKLNVAVSGFVLAYVDKEYEVGTPLTCTADGCLTEIKLEDKIKYPERVVATYWKNEPNEEWGPEDKKVRVNGRRWVKVK